jgi:hypothetical protein
VSLLAAQAAGPITASDIEVVSRPFGGCGLFFDALDSIHSNQPLLDCLTRYVQFNAVFGSGVASLAGAIGSRRDLFRDPTDTVAALADRSTEIAASIFYAAIDEFGGSKGRYPTHRVMARDFLKAVALHSGCSLSSACDSEPFSAAVAEGYGIGRSLDDGSLFAAIGFHIGSESLADEEFRILDEFLRSRFAGLVRCVEQDRTTGGHAAYLWVQAHTKIEVDHFESALRGANRAIEFYAGSAEPPSVRNKILDGVRQFAALQADFMRILAYNQGGLP